MHTRIRKVRKAKGLTLQEVAARCTPPTTAQTIGRLETGARTVSVSWLTRIARALDVDPSELVNLPDRPDVPVAAVLGAGGVERPRRAMVLVPPRAHPDLIGLTVEVAQGEYRAGDEVWLTRLEPESFALGLNKDILAPLPVYSGSEQGQKARDEAETASASIVLNGHGSGGGKGSSSSGSANGSGSISSGNSNGSGVSSTSGSGLVFGRLVSATPSELQVVPLAWGSQPICLPAPDWIATVSVLMRKL